MTDEPIVPRAETIAAHRAVFIEPVPLDPDTLSPEDVYSHTIIGWVRGAYPRDPVHAEHVCLTDRHSSTGER